MSADRHLNDRQFRATRPKQVAEGTWREVYADTGELVHKNPAVQSAKATKPAQVNGRWREVPA